MLLLSVFVVDRITSRVRHRSVDMKARSLVTWPHVSTKLQTLVQWSISAAAIFIGDPSWIGKHLAWKSQEDTMLLNAHEVQQFALFAVH